MKTCYWFLSAFILQVSVVISSQIQDESNQTQIMPGEEEGFSNYQGQFQDDFYSQVQASELDSDMDQVSEEKLGHLQEHQAHMRMHTLQAFKVQPLTENKFVTHTSSYYNTITSAEPLKPGYVNELTVKWVTNGRFLLGLDFGKDTMNYDRQHIGQNKNSMGYYNNGGNIYPGSRTHLHRSNQGDEITIKVDLREGKYTVEYLKNGYSMGLTATGIDRKDINQIYAAISLRNTGATVEVVRYRFWK